MNEITLKEILQQPSMWAKTIEIIDNRRKDFETYIDELGPMGSYDVLLIGAGTSEYVGNSIVSALNHDYNGRVFSVASTELVPYPRELISSHRKTLAIHFGRSGNSPESIHSVKMLQQLNPEIHHLSITCNPQGALSRINDFVQHSFIINLPEETHDQGFAMTSSFTSMTLAAFYLLSPRFKSFKLESWLNQVRINLPIYHHKAQEMVKSFNYHRLVVLGALEHKGFAQESALKSLELSSGQVATLYDSPMGFRHGPKSFLDDRTLVLFYLRQLHQAYELDVIKEIAANKRGSQLYVLGNESYGLDDQLWEYDPVLQGLGRMPFAQLLAFYKSVSLNIDPDSPSKDNEVNRVVSGVTLYPLENEA
jgi:tagatose-6-phosphate ketose/aldose isomerase